MLNYSTLDADKEKPTLWYKTLYTKSKNYRRKCGVEITIKHSFNITSSNHD